VYSGKDHSLIFQKNGTGWSYTVDAGDLNGDGVPDLFVGEMTQTPTPRARAFSGLNGSPIPGLVFYSDGIDDGFGVCVSSIGDITGDGVTELIVGALDNYVVIYSGADGSRVKRIDGPVGQSGDDFGISVSEAGDVNGDGTPDFIVGDNTAPNGAGSAFVFSGRIDQDFPIIYRLDGENPGDLFGGCCGSVDTVGDLNGDGRMDLAVTALEASPSGKLAAGSVYIFDGATGTPFQRFDGQGPMRFDGENPGDLLGGEPSCTCGWISVVGDLNLDGYPDFMMGAVGATVNNEPYAGRVLIFSGYDTSVLLRIDNPDSNYTPHFFGVSGATLGDLDGDGTIEVIIGAFDTTVDGSGLGSAYLLSISTTHDTDGDGMPDIWELSNGLDPNNSGDAGLDDDSDGFINLEEYTGNSDPQDNQSVPNFVTTQDNLSQTLRLVVPPGVDINDPQFDFQWVDPATLPTNPSGDFPHGLISMTLPVSLGATVTVAVTFQGSVATNSVYNKYGPTASPQWYFFPYGSNDGDAMITLTLTDQLTAIATRLSVQTGADVGIGGFIIDGTNPKTILVRGRGPSMGGAPFNVPGTLSNPYLTLYSGSLVVAENDNWRTKICSICGDEQDIIATGLDLCQPNPGQSSPPPGCDFEAAILITLPPGNYTAILNGASGGTGVGLVEVFDVSTGTIEKLIAIATRGLVLTGADVMIGGLIIEGTVPKTVLLRGRGPSMGGAPFNVPGTLGNPTLTIYSGSTPIAQNDNWGTTNPQCDAPATACGNDQDIIATGLDPCQPNPGQSSPPSGCALESAVIITLPPGPYTAIMSGVNSTTGVGLVEVFEVP